MRKSIILDEIANDKVMNLTSKMIKETKQSWSVSNIINSVLMIAFDKEITVDMIIKIQDKLGRE